MIQYGLNILAILLVFWYMFGVIYGMLYLVPSIIIFDIIIAKFGYERITDMDLFMNILSDNYNTNIAVYMEI